MDENPQQKMEWLTLKEASAILGVHPATLRTWADDGHVRIFRTPGGHRRFLRSDIEAMTAPAAGGREMVRVDDRLATAAVAHARQDLSRLDASSETWFSAFDESERETWRESGRRLIGLAIQYVARRQGRQAMVDEARNIGSMYGIMCAGHGIPLSGMVRAFFFFRESVLKATRPGMVGEGRYDEEEARIHREMRQFLDEPFYAMLETYDAQRLSGWGTA